MLTNPLVVVRPPGFEFPGLVPPGFCDSPPLIDERRQAAILVQARLRPRLACLFLGFKTYRDFGDG